MLLAIVQPDRIWLPVALVSVLLLGVLPAGRAFAYLSRRRHYRRDYRRPWGGRTAVTGACSIALLAIVLPIAITTHSTGPAAAQALTVQLAEPDPFAGAATTFRDTFDTQDTVAWVWSGHQTVPFDDGGNNVVRSVASSERFGGNFYRSASLSDGTGVEVRFKLDSLYTEAHFAIESDPQSAETYRRFAVIAGRGVIYSQYMQGTNEYYPGTLLSGVQTGIWYVARIRVDERNGFTIEVWQESDPAVRGAYRQTMDAARQWRFHHWLLNYSVALDDYREVNFGTNPALHHGAPSTPWTQQVAGVNVVFGHSLFQQQDILLPGRGVPIGLIRSYSSADASDVGFGIGWSFDFGMSITAEAAETVLVRQADGRRDRFATADGIAYTPPAGIYDTLVKSADGAYTLTTPDQLVHRFDAQGRLVSIADRNGLTTTVTYAASGITLTDAGGRTLVLAYGPDGKHFETLTDGSLSPARTVVYGYDPATGDLTSVRDVRGQTTQLTYENHRLKTVVDPNGNTVIENTYDASTGKVVSQRDANTVAAAAVVGTRQALTFDYSVPGQTKVTGRRSYATTYFYDGGYRVTSIDDTKGYKYSYAWDARNDLICTTDRKGNRTGYQYDGRGNVARITPADNASASDATCEPVDPAKVFEFTYTVRNDVQTATLPAAPVRGNPYRRVTTYGYDANGNLRTVALPPTPNRPEGATTTYDPDPATGDVRSVQTPDGFTTSFGYDANGNLEWATDPSIPAGPGIENRTIFTVDRAGRVRKRTDPLGNWVEYDYDAANRVTVVRAVADRTTGRIITTSQVYDPAGRPTDATDGNGRVTHTVYDPNGNAREVYVAWGTAKQGRVLYEHDASGNVARRTDADGLVTAYEYDTVDLLSTVTTPKPDRGVNNIAVYGYDANGNRTSLLDPNGYTSTFEYDARDRLRAVHYPATAAAAAFDATYTYDALGNRTAMTDTGAGTTTYGYDELGRLVSAIRGSYATLYDYDLGDARCTAGRASRLTYPAGYQATYCYDQAYRMTRVYDWNGGRFTYTYDLAGRPWTLDYPNGTKATFYHDDAGRLTGVDHERLAAATAVSAAALPAPGAPAPAAAAAPSGATATRAGARATAATPAATPAPAERPHGRKPLPPGIDVAAMEAQFTAQATSAGRFFAQTYALDDAGNRASLVEPLSWDPTNYVITFGYDAQDRLETSRYPGTAAPTVYAYSANGHRLSLTEGRTVVPYKYDGAQRLILSDRGRQRTTYEYDANGNQTGRTTGRNEDIFTYDGGNRLVKANTAAGGVATYAHDGDGLRAAVTAGTVTARQTWDANRALPVLLSDGTSLYLYGAGDTPLARFPQGGGAGGAAYYHADGLGSTRAITDAGGATTAFCNYDEFGAAYDLGSACPEDVAFTGQGYDGASRTYHLRARQYDPATGRFTSPDPTGYAGGGNLYAYAGNNPATWVDRAGTAPTDPLSGRRREGGGVTNPARPPRANGYTVAFEMTLTDADIPTSRRVHETRASVALANVLRTDPAFARQLRAAIPDIDGAAASRYAPQGWTWHHHAARVGVVQLVPKYQHTKGSRWWRLMHPDGSRGGYELWAVPQGAKK